jgi:hypothetical protein
MLTHAFSAHPNNNNNVGLHTFVHGENQTKTLHKNSREKKLTPQKMWGITMLGCIPCT